MSVNNLPEEKENVNNEDLEIKHYYSVYSDNFEKLWKIDPVFNTLTLYHYLLSKHTYKNGLSGIFYHITIYSLAEKFKIHKDKVFNHLQKLEKNGLIKILNKSPLIIQMLEIPYLNNKFNTLEEVLKYVALNQSEFKFDTSMMKNRANEFFTCFEKQYREIYSKKYLNFKNKEQVKEDKPTIQKEQYNSKYDENSPDFDPF